MKSWSSGTPPRCDHTHSQDPMPRHTPTAGPPTKVSNSQRDRTAWRWSLAYPCRYPDPPQNVGNPEYRIGIRCFGVRGYSRFARRDHPVNTNVDISSPVINRGYHIGAIDQLFAQNRIY